MTRHILPACILALASAGFSFGQTGFTLTTTPNPSSVGQQVFMTAGPVPSGRTVTFKDNGFPIGTATATGNSALYSTAGLAAGSHPLTACYDTPSESGTFTTCTPVVIQIVNTPQTNLRLTSSANPADSCQTITLVATITPANAPGTITFLDGTNKLGVSNLSGGIATLAVNLTIGPHILQAQYTPAVESGFASSSALLNEAVTGTVNMTLSSTPNPSNPGQNVAIQAIVAGAGCPSNQVPTPNGSVQFFDGNSQLGTVNLSSGSATFPTSTLTVGTHALRAIYSGEPNFPQTSASSTHTVITGGTIGLSASPNPATFGQTVNVAASVTPVNAPGSVQFFDNGSSIGQRSVANGQAALSNQFAVGSHVLTAQYLGDAVNPPMTSAPVTLVVNKAPTTVSLTPSASTVNVGQTLSLNAVVAPPGATGTVQFLDNGASVTTVSVSNGSATYQTSSLSQTTHSFTAIYSGDGNYQGSTSPAASVNVTTAPRQSTSTSLTVNPGTSTFGQNVVFLATVRPASGGGSPTGTVTFFDGNDSSAVSLVNGTATYSTSTLVVGSHSVVATYGGDDNFLSSSSDGVTEQVNKALTTTTLSAAPTSSNLNQTVKLTAVITSLATAAITGTVTFMDGTAAIGSPVTIPNGVASVSITTSFSTSGNHSLTAVYSGDRNFNGSTSSAVPESVGLTPSTTTLSVTPQSSSFGISVTLTATVTPAGATGSVEFRDGSTSLGTRTLSNGVATFSTAALTAGSHAVVAVYSGDVKYSTSTSDPFTTTVTKAATTTSLSASPSPGTTGKPVTLRAVVTPATATGTVTFQEGSTNLGSATLSNGVASVNATFTTGTHNLTASYQGDANNASSSGSAAEVVGPSNPPANITPTSLPNAVVGVPYSQSFAVGGGSGALTWTLASGTVPGLTLSAAGLLAGPPTTAGTYSLTIRVQDSAGSATSTVLTLTVLPLPSLSITAPRVLTPTDQPAPQVSMASAYSLPLTAIFTLSFDGSVSGLPVDYVNPGVKFASGGTTTPPVSIAANSISTIALPGVQMGSVAGTITVKLSSLTIPGGQSVLPANPPTATIPVAPVVPVIVTQSVKIINVTSSGFTVVLDASSNPRDLLQADLTFAPASGAQLNGTQLSVPLTGIAKPWFASTSGIANGGSFGLTLPFNYTGDPNALGSLSISLRNSVGSSTPATVSK